MIYINTDKRKLVNSVNFVLDRKLSFDYEDIATLEITFFDRQGKPIAYDPADEFYIIGNDQLNGDKPIFYSEEAELDGNVVSFEVDTYTENYLAKILNRDTAIFVEIGVKKAEDTYYKVLYQDEALAQPRIRMDGVPPSPPDEYYTAAQVNGLLADLTAADITTEARGSAETQEAFNGYVVTALAAGGEGSSFYQPVANYLVNDATYGAVYYLDSLIPSIVFAERVLNLKKVRIRLVSANPAVTGNIVIVPAVDGVDQTPITLAVTATAATREIEFATAVTGRFTLRRDYAAAADTIDNVTAIVTALRILEV